MNDLGSIACAGFAVLLFVGAGVSGAAEMAEGELFFETKVRPILHGNCFECHGEEKQKAGLRLDSLARVLQGGDSGPAIVPRDAKASLLVQAIHWEKTEYLGDEELEMPPKQQLPPEKIAALVQWVAMGAPWPESDLDAGAVAEADPGARIREASATHWAFQKVDKVAPPKVKDGDWCQSPVDRFLLARMEAEGFSPSAVANEVVLMRRAYLDLLGMPPAPEEAERFLKAEGSLGKRFRLLVDELLDDPRYGERWGRHWLDVARYGDSKGPIFGETKQYPYAFTYRDYVIQSFNEDKPYDEFVMEQLAADQLGRGEGDPSLAALGFLTVHRRSNTGGDEEDWADRVDTVGRGLLGLTVACARCHDHKYDPIPTADFYSLYGVFASTEEPEELPVIGRPEKGSELATEYAKLLVEENRMIREYREENYERVLAQYRSEAGKFLSAYEEARGMKDAALQILAGKKKINPYILMSWRDFLESEASEGNAVLAAWRAFAAVEAKEFAKVAEEVASGTIGGVEVNPLISEIFGGAAPKSLEEVAEMHQVVFDDVIERWDERRRNPKATGLDSAPREEIRRLLYGESSPGVIPAADFKKLERKVYLKLMTMEADRTLRLALHPGAPRKAMALRDKEELYDPVIFVRGNADRPGDPVPRRFLEILSEEERAPFAEGSGRLELAKAIVDPGNPLTARVFVNRVWMHHFGTGLVETPSDFGLRAGAPLHGELLDWLAATFVEGGWSVKDLHRLIMNSAVYQQSNHGDVAKYERDPDNRYHWRFERRRLEFEAIHDSMLAVSGRLDPAIGGPAVLLTGVDGRNQGNNSATWEVNPYRRAVYGAVDRTKLPSLFLTFDFANPDESNARRDRTTVPTQGLYMMNNPFVMELASSLVRREGLGSSEEERIRRLYQLLFSREPSADELARGTAFLSSASSDGGGKPREESPWSYGVAPYDVKAGNHELEKFGAFPFLSPTKMQGAEEYPDKSGGYGWTKLTPMGGHAGNTRYCVVRRWTSPVNGKVNFTGTMRHSSDAGNGVRATVFGPAGKVLGEWSVHQAEERTDLGGIAVRKGEQIDFVVDCMGDGSYASFQWAPLVHLESGEGAGSWSSKADFARAGKAGEAKKDVSLDAWERYAHVLLMSNEFAFIP